MEDSEWQDESRSLTLPREHPHAAGPLHFLIPFGWGVDLGIGCEILHFAILQYIGADVPCVDLRRAVKILTLITSQLRSNQNVGFKSLDAYENAGW